MISLHLNSSCFSSSFLPLPLPLSLSLFLLNLSFSGRVPKGSATPSQTPVRDQLSINPAGADGFDEEMDTSYQNQVSTLLLIIIY